MPHQSTCHSLVALLRSLLEMCRMQLQQFFDSHKLPSSLHLLSVSIRVIFDVCSKKRLSRLRMGFLHRNSIGLEALLRKSSRRIMDENQTTGIQGSSSGMKVEMNFSCHSGCRKWGHFC
jgi:hypothetical protein